MPKRGYGQSNKLAQFIGAHTTLVSQVMKGIKTFTFEQAALTADFLGLNDFESEFFLLLVQWDRAGNESLRKNLKRQIDQAKIKSAELEHRLKSDKKISEEQRAIFYSDWIYSAVRQLTAIDGFQNKDAIAVHFQISKKQTKEVIDFLLSTGLCIEIKGELRPGPSSTHLGASSPWVRIHHMNWRQKAMEQINKKDAVQLHYTAPLTVSKKHALKIREMIISFLAEVDTVIEPSPSEELLCMNIDWFKVGS